ncbi:MAG: hypothetical protein HY765_03065 [Rhodomicrobium sp.]|nr:hypothetical protein [Rhodomicrobium sp.]
MRTVSIGVAAAFLFASTFGTFATPVTPSGEGIQYKSHFVFVKTTKKKYKKTAKAKGKKVKTAKLGPGKCGTGKYWSKKERKCLSASEKKPPKT